MYLLLDCCIFSLLNFSPAPSSPAQQQVILSLLDFRPAPSSPAQKQVSPYQHPSLIAFVQSQNKGQTRTWDCRPPNNL